MNISFDVLQELPISYTMLCVTNFRLIEFTPIQGEQVPLTADEKLKTLRFNRFCIRTEVRNFLANQEITFLPHCIINNPARKLAFPHL
jgi:hypothetical protein